MSEGTPEPVLFHAFGGDSTACSGGRVSIPSQRVSRRRAGSTKDRCNDAWRRLSHRRVAQAGIEITTETQSWQTATGPHGNFLSARVRTRDLLPTASRTACGTTSSETPSRTLPAGIIVLLRRKMRIGDFIEREGIEREGIEGKIEDIPVRETHKHGAGDQLVIVPAACRSKPPAHPYQPQPATYDDHLRCCLRRRCRWIRRGDQGRSQRLPRVADRSETDRDLCPGARPLGDQLRSHPVDRLHAARRQAIQRCCRRGREQSP